MNDQVSQDALQSTDKEQPSLNVNDGAPVARILPGTPAAAGEAEAKPEAQG